MKFNGELKFPELDHPGVPVQFVVDEDQAEIVVDGESLGRWSLYDVHAKRLVSSAFLVDLDGTEVTFVAADPIDFAYRGVEHMAETWAKIKSRRPGSRSIAVRKSRKGLIPSRIEDLRHAMESNLESTGPRAIAGETSMPGTASQAASVEAEHFETDWDRRDTDASIPVVGAVSPVEAAPAPGESVSAPEPVFSPEIEEERRRLAEERAQLEKERQAAEQREANLLEAYRLEMQRLEAEREELRRQTEAAGLAAEQAALERERTEQRAAQLEAAERAAQQRAAEEARIAAEEEARRAAEERAAEEARIEAEARAAEEKRIAAEKEAQAEAEARAAEEARIAAEERAQREAERAAADEARIAAEEQAQREAEARATEEARIEAEEHARRQEEEAERREVAEREAAAAAAEPRVVDLNDLEDGAPSVSPTPQPVLADAKDKGGLMGAVKAAFRGGSKDHVHQFVEAPGGIGITRYVCEECAYVSISVGS
ncbi:MAG TPA: hypothetical protein VFS66_08500 [Acidimicrobiia bacterium]|nr:hypothetical protein [Acidimicrobiia bacterium]